jgi:DNA-directed RNA polymerase subunit K/omega
MGTKLRFPAAQPEPDSTALNASTRRAYQFLIDAFTETVAANEEHKYMLTTAIYEILSGDINPSIEKGVPEARFDGVEFPSIAARGNLLNYALRPEVVDSSLELFRVEAFKLTGIEGTEYDLWAIAKGIPLNGVIEWGDFENEFQVELALGTATVTHGEQGFRVLPPDGVVAAGF